MRKAQKLMVDADRSLRVGDFEMALKLLEELGQLMPGDPSVLLRKAQVLERLDQPAEAVVILEEAMKYPGLPQEVRSQAQAKLDELSKTLAQRPSAPQDVTPALPDAAGQTFAMTSASSRGEPGNCRCAAPRWQAGNQVANAGREIASWILHQCAGCQDPRLLLRTNGGR